MVARAPAQPGPELDGLVLPALWNALTGFDTALAMAAMVLSSASPILCAGLATLALLWSVHTAARAPR